MKITLVCRTYPTQRPGGMPHVCQDRAEALALAGHTVQVLTTGHEHMGVVQHDELPLVVRHLPCPPQGYTDEFALGCAKAVQETQPDVLHFDSFDRERSQWWRELKGPLRVVTMHGFTAGAELTQWNKYLSIGGKPPTRDHEGMKEEAQALADADLVLAISAHEERLLDDVYNLFGKVVRVPNPIAPCFFASSPCPVPDEAPWVCIGNPGTSGNRAFHLAAQAAERAGVPFKVVTNVAREQIPGILDESAGLLLPTWWAQGFDLAVAEAAARGRHTVASATGSYYTEAREGAPISLFRRGDVEGMVAAMKLPRSVLFARHWAQDQHHPKAHARLWAAAVQERL